MCMPLFGIIQKQIQHLLIINITKENVFHSLGEEHIQVGMYLEKPTAALLISLQAKIGLVFINWTNM